MLPSTQEPYLLLPLGEALAIVVSPYSNISPSVSRFRRATSHRQSVSSFPCTTLYALLRLLKLMCAFYNLWVVGIF